MGTMQIDDLTFDEHIYPREHRSQSTINAYVEALSIGAQFPPITVQQVTNFDGANVTTLILDGMHRFEAFQSAERQSIETVSWKNEVLDYQAHKRDLLFESIRLNTAHGDRLSNNDRMKTAQAVAVADPEISLTNVVLSQVFGVSEKTISNWIGPIRARQRASRDAVIVRLTRLGWTQEEVAEVVGMSQNRISEIIGNCNFTEIDNLLAEGHDMDYVAGHYQIDLPLAWALHLEGKSDQEKFKALDWGLRTWDLWNFNDRDSRFGVEWPGNIPAQLVAHTLFYFTSPGDLVFDPMAGGGVVPDTCLAFERKCRAFDLAPERPDIQSHDWLTDTWPNVKKADLIFFDPPYFSKMADDYADKAGESTSISSLPKQQYLDFFRAFLINAREHSKDTTRIAFLNADWRAFNSTPAMQENAESAITIFDYHDTLQSSGWTVTHRIECPMSSQRFQAGVVSAMQARRILGTVGRTLLLAKRMS